MQFNERLDLRGGRTCWREHVGFSSDILPMRADIVIVGAGIMGAMIADRLSAGGCEVVILDRRQPIHGATSSSTALVMWAADVPLTHLAKRIGEDEAQKRWRQVFASLEHLNDRVGRLECACGWMSRPEIYLTGSLLDCDAMKAEADLRQRAGLPSAFREASAVTDRFGIAPRAGLVSGGSYEVDPIALTAGLLEGARANGARLCFPHDVAKLTQTEDGVRIALAEGSDLIAQTVILATGYEPSRFFLPAAFSLSSSFAIASKPDMAALWSENALIWEAAQPYLYARANADGRILVGGGDETLTDAATRDALIGEKAGVLQSKARALLEEPSLEFEFAWASTFGGTPDGLPAIGRARGSDRVWLAYGYGGNGVTFAALAADLIEAALAGSNMGEVSHWFDPYRFG